LKLHVLIRVRSGDFLYTDEEIAIMKSDVEACRDLGVDGVVFGCLNSDGFIDEARTAELAQAAEGMSVTFHRAFDVSRDAARGLESVIAVGCDRLLTSGLAPTALQGAEQIASLIGRAAGRVVVMPGCGISEANIGEIARRTGATEFHMSLRRAVPSAMTWRCETVSMLGTLPPELGQLVTSADCVSSVIRTLDEVMATR
jgi:copper homeostasis protein